MKYLMLLTILFSASLWADIEVLPGDATAPDASEVESSRSCFKEIETFGCRHPREDQVAFRSCMAHVHASLSESCQRMMTELYGKK